jgi:hypothetical protein
MAGVDTSAAGPTRPAAPAQPRASRVASLRRAPRPPLQDASAPRQAAASGGGAAPPASCPPGAVVSPTSLPPLVEGELRGELTLTLTELQWLSPRAAPRAARLRVKWWGEPGAGTAAPLRPATASSAGGGEGGGGGDGSGGVTVVFPVRVGPKLLTRYLRDASALELALEELPSGRPVAAATLALAPARAAAPLCATLPLLGLRGQALGQADVQLRASFSGAMASFEINEQRASTERGLPLYPAPAGAAAAAASAVAGAPEREAGERRSEPAAAGAAEGGAGGAPAAAALPQDMADVSAGLAAALAQAPWARQGPGPAAAAADPFADLIAKAERLKAAMDAAIGKGLGPELGLLPAATPADADLAAGAGVAAGAAAAGQPRAVAPNQQLLGRLLQAAAGLRLGGAGAVEGADEGADEGAPPSPGASSGGTPAGDDGDSSGFSEFEDLEDIEDLLLQQLFFPSKEKGPSGARERQRPQEQLPPGGEEVDGAPRNQAADAAPGGASASGAAAAPVGGARPAGVPLVVTLLGTAEGRPPRCADGRAATRLLARARVAADPLLDAAARPGSVEAELPWQPHDAASGDGRGPDQPVDLELEAPPSLLPWSGLPRERVWLAVELWGAPEGGGGGEPRQLLGIARLPLDRHLEHGAAAASGGSGVVGSAGRSPLQLDAPQMLKSGTVVVWDVLADRGNGFLRYAVTLLPPAPPPAPPSPGAPPAASPARGAAPRAPSPPAAPSPSLDPAEAPSPAPAQPAAALVGVLHRFDVSVHSVSGLPCPAALRAAGRAAPEFRFAGYLFPGEPGEGLAGGIRSGAVAGASARRPASCWPAPRRAPSLTPPHAPPAPSTAPPQATPRRSTRGWCPARTRPNPAAPPLRRPYFMPPHATPSCCRPAPTSRASSRRARRRAAPGR